MRQVIGVNYHSKCVISLEFHWIPLISLDFPLKLIFVYINGPHNQYIWIDMSLTFVFRQGLPSKSLFNRPVINPPNPHAQARGGGGVGGWFRSLRLRHLRGIP